MSNRLYSNRTKEEKRRSISSGPKAFKSEESANKWAKENNIKEYKLRNLRGEGKKKKIKIQIV
ncbi:hypothetical protein ISS05_03120 [Candidatus Woesearchaeota archaeon]|nr:hypothetical protein [Candidatus Woesearchaeota archaeon]